MAPLVPGGEARILEPRQEPRPVLGLVLFLLLALGGPLLLGRYLGRLPDAPQCPRCASLTLARAGGAAWSVLPQLSSTSLRECTHCGWRGRMRWRWATASSDEA